MQNCVNHASLTAGSDFNYSMIGGFVGYPLSTRERFENCINYGNITVGEIGTAGGNTRAAGICGLAMRGATLINCENHGAIKATRPTEIAERESLAAGLATGGVGDDHTYMDLTLTNCVNTGGVTAIADSNNQAAGLAIGGIKKIDKCSTTGEVSTKDGTSTTEIITRTNFELIEPKILDDDYAFETKVFVVGMDTCEVSVSDGKSPERTDTYIWNGINWTGFDYDIHYNLGGGTNAAVNPSEYNVETETITLADPTNDGYYVFDGWYEETTFETAVTKIAKGSTGTITLYAKWRDMTDEEKLIKDVKDTKGIDITLEQAEATYAEGIAEADKIPSNGLVTTSGLALAVYQDTTPLENVWLKVAVNQLAYENDGKTLVIDAKPMRKIERGDYNLIPNSEIKGPVTFRLYLPTNFSSDAKYVDVKHIKDNGSEIYKDLEIKTDNDDLRYIEITVTEFSQFHITAKAEVPAPVPAPEPEKAPIEGAKTPQTGDNSNVWLFLSLAVMSLGGIGFVAFKRK